MFGLFGNKSHKEAADKIGVELHRQLFAALKENEEEASNRIGTTFMVGYLYGFVRLGFTHQGYPGEKLTDKYMKYICNGVLPNKLYNLFNAELDTLKYAKEKSKNMRFYEIGTEAGVYDAAVFDSLTPNNADNLFKYLTKKELKYTPMAD